MKILLIILCITTISWGQFGSIDMDRYISLIDKIEKMYRPYAKAYNDTAKETNYVFDFSEIFYFPYDCTEINRDSSGQTMYIYPYGGIIRSKIDSNGIEHVQISTIRYVTYKDIVNIKYYELFFYKIDSTGTWKEERKSIKVNLYKDGLCK